MTLALARIDGVADELARDRVVDEALRCVSSWETREDIRDAAEKAGRAGGEAGATANAEALVDVAGADPAMVEQYRAALDRRLDEQLRPALEAARAEIEDPTCDLGEARRVVDEEEHR